MKINDQFEGLLTKITPRNDKTNPFFLRAVGTCTQNPSVMRISDHKSLKVIKEEFHEAFPHLKLEFYAAPHDKNQGSPAQQQLPDDQSVGEVRTVHETGDFFFNGQFTVANFERQFADKYGLYAQVFRKSGNLWLQTSATDSWTLAEQNRKGGHSEELYYEQNN